MINAIVDVTDNGVRLRLEKLPTSLRNRFEQTIRGLTNELLSRVKANEPNVTGRLRRQTHAYVDNNKVKGFVRGRVRVLNMRNKNIAAGFGALEYGSTGRAFGVKGYSRGGNSVKGYSRRGGIKAQRFLRSAAATVIPKARQELQRALQETLQNS